MIGMQQLMRLVFFDSPLFRIRIFTGQRHTCRRRTEIFQEDYNRHGDADATIAVHQLTKYLSRYYGKKVIVLLTGITRISKESIFSDLNNLKVVTTTSKKYETAFGFTEEEVFHALEEFGLQEEQQNEKKWYDGFQFGTCSSIYNPWSIINFLDERKFMNYWANSSSNKLISDLIQKSSTDIKMTMEDLLHGKSFRTSFDEEIVFSQLDYSENAV